MDWFTRKQEKSAWLGFGILWIIVGILAIFKPTFYFKGAYVDFTGYNVQIGAVFIIIGIAYIGVFFRRPKKR